MKIDSVTCFWQQLFYSIELNSTSEIKPSLSVATVVVQYSKLLQPFLSLDTTILLLWWGRVLHHETKHGTEVWRFNRYFINNNNNNKKKMKINIIINNNINIDNVNNNNSNEDLDSLPMTEPQYRFWNSMLVVIRKLLHFALLHYAFEKLLQFALKYYYILRWTFYYILRQCYYILS